MASSEEVSPPSFPLPLPRARELGPFSRLRWFRIRSTLRCLRAGPPGSEPGWKILDTAALMIWLHAGQPGEERKNRLSVRAPGKRHSWRPAAGESFLWDVLLLVSDLELSLRLAASIREHFADPRHNYEVIQAGEPEVRSLDILIAENPQVEQALESDHSQVVLDFIMPLSFRAEVGRTHSYLSASHLAALARDRIRRVTGLMPLASDLDPPFEIFPYYWETVIVHRISGSRGSLDSLGGCEGPLLIKGDLRSILPELLICSETGMGESPGHPKRRPPAAPSAESGAADTSAGQSGSDAPGSTIATSAEPEPEAQGWKPGDSVHQQVKYSGGYFVFRDRDFLPCSARLADPRLFRTAIASILEKRDDADGELTGESGFDVENEGYLEALMEEVRAGTYAPSPFKAFCVPKHSGGTRIIEKARVRDLLVQTAIHQVLSPILERAFEECSTGFRPHRSRENAFGMIKAAVQDGYLWVAETDIENFFPSVDHEKLRATLTAILPDEEARFVALVMATIMAPFEYGGTIRERSRGIPQGNPVSADLANLYLDRLDELYLTDDLRFVRYADDFVILAKTEEAAQAALESGRQLLATMGLTLKAEKTAVKPVDEGFEFLGIRFGDGPLDHFDHDAPFRQPLYITTPFSYLTVANDCVELRAAKTLIGSVPIRRVGEILVLERAVISTTLMSRCMRENIPISITLGTGYHICTVRRDARKDYSLAWMHGKKYFSLTEGDRLSLAREIALAKIENYRTLYSGRRIPEAQLEVLDRACEGIATSADCDSIRGWEGSAARHCYRLLDTLVSNPDFHFEKRGREIKDRMNSLLNYGYYLLFTRMNALLRASGLDPYLGILHSDADRYESLVCDLEEGFRPHVDRFILRIINTNVITASSFTESERGFFLTQDARSAFLQSWERELQGKARKNGLTVREAMEVQIHLLRTWVEGSTGISFYRWQP